MRLFDIHFTVSEARLRCDRQHCSRAPNEEQRNSIERKMKWMRNCSSSIDDSADQTQPSLSRRRTKGPRKTHILHRVSCNTRFRCMQYRVYLHGKWKKICEMKAESTCMTLWLREQCTYYDEHIVRGFQIADDLFHLRSIRDTKVWMEQTIEWQLKMSPGANDGHDENDGTAKDNSITAMRSNKRERTIEKQVLSTFKMCAPPPRSAHPTLNALFVLLHSTFHNGCRPLSSHCIHILTRGKEMPMRSISSRQLNTTNARKKRNDLFARKWSHHLSEHQPAAGSQPPATKRTMK